MNDLTEEERKNIINEIFRFQNELKILGINNIDEYNFNSFSDKLLVNIIKNQHTLFAIKHFMVSSKEPPTITYNNNILKKQNWWKIIVKYFNIMVFKKRIKCFL